MTNKTRKTIPTNDDIEDSIRDALPEALVGEFNELLRELNEAKDEVIAAEKERDDLQELLDATPDEEKFAEMVGVLETVKYWFHDVMYLGKPMTDPRKILRIVEAAL